MASPWRASRVRSIVLAAIVIVLAGTLGAYLTRRKSRAPEPPPPKRIAEDVGQQTQAFSLSKTVGEHTLYTIRAEQVTNYEDTGKAQLHGVSVLIFGKDGSRLDKITSAECVYDPAAASIWVPGEVEMQFDVAGPESKESAGTRTASMPISIFTSKLSFEQESGVATTDAPVRFLFAGGEGSSQGATFDSEKQLLTLKSAVSFTLTPSADDRKSASAQSDAGEKTLVRANSLQFDRLKGMVLLENAVELTKGSRKIRAARGEIELDVAYRVHQVRFVGGVIASEETATDFLEARAEHANAVLNEAGRIRAVELDQDVTWSIQPRSHGGRKDGAAQHAELLFRDADGQLVGVRAERNVRMTFRGEPRAGNTAASDTQKLSAGVADLTMAPGGKTLRELRMTGSPLLEIMPGRSGADRRTVTGDVFTIGLDDRGELSRFRAEGGARVISEDAGTMARRESMSDRLEAFFDPAGGIERLRQWGHFEYRDRERQARAEEANYAVASEAVVLTGKPVIWNEAGRLTAARIELETRSGGMRAEGSVASTFFQQPSAGHAANEPVHAVADHMRYESASKRSRFLGHARLWQGESFLLEANSLDWSPQEGELTATGKVYSIFRDQTAGNDRTPSASGAPAANRKDDSVTITADSLGYQQQRRLAHYAGSVQLRKSGGRMTAAELDIFLEQPSSPTPASLSLSVGQIERAVAQGDVKIVDGARVATGERAEYLPASDEVHLFGAVARVVDPDRGAVEGAELTYFLGDDRIQVQGSPGSPTETRWQVHP